MAHHTTFQPVIPILIPINNQSDHFIYFSYLPLTVLPASKMNQQSIPAKRGRPQKPVEPQPHKRTIERRLADGLKLKAIMDLIRRDFCDIRGFLRAFNENQETKPARVAFLRSGAGEMIEAWPPQLTREVPDIIVCTVGDMCDKEIHTLLSDPEVQPTLRYSEDKGDDGPGRRGLGEDTRAGV